MLLCSNLQLFSLSYGVLGGLGVLVQSAPRSDENLERGIHDSDGEESLSGLRTSSIYVGLWALRMDSLSDPDAVSKIIPQGAPTAIIVVTIPLRSPLHPFDSQVDNMLIDQGFQQVRFSMNVTEAQCILKQIR